MPIESQLLDNGTKLIIKVTGHFDFSQHKAFRNAYDDHKDKVETCVVDLSQAEHMDSAALGMLLVLKESAETNKATVIISSPSDNIQSILSISKFESLFHIES